ncbi:hypothetical protein E2P84_38925 [Burkholderia cepacia]|uniref:Secreted protein n=1 Tax=Burkholderia cepacia TaxID=292 RepID=A0AAX2RCQ5_BURCE|nr:hypothetical protein E2P84_38925 [Burkholderia cepacia]TES96721.1 hypothetical protein E3D36_34725 [Burkholderia cepacia]TEU34409.1 hypothetical protein E3D37_39005 [Burkholderia cepacia]TEU38519.1 hypothetical protein E3D38_37575 [Burkholderia cepacia]TEU87156.1 hypothetical protein E3D40_39355 [Burkholderia cepacia]
MPIQSRISFFPGGGIFLILLVRTVIPSLASLRGNRPPSRQYQSRWPKGLSWWLFAGAPAGSIERCTR